MSDSRSEAERQNAIFLKYGREPDVTLFRNNTGQAKTPICERAHLERLLSMIGMFGDGPIDQRSIGNACALIRALLKEPQRFTKYGLAKGSSDIIGIVQVARRVDFADICARGGSAGIFLALEVKTEKGRVSPEQQIFLDLVNKRGGIGRVVRNEDDVGRAIDDARAL